MEFEPEKDFGGGRCWLL